MNRDEIVILGAGLAGLSTAYHLKDGYSLFEERSEPGGMARSIYKDGYLFDYDGHLLHFKDEYTFSLVKELLNGNLAPHKRRAWIYSKGNYTPYPFQANFYGLPKSVVKDCLLGFIKSRVNFTTHLSSPHRGEGKGEGDNLSYKKDLEENFESWIKRTFGTGIAGHFMLPYNKKFWTVEPSELMCDWLDGFVPVPTIEDTITGAISVNTKLYGYNSRFWYPVKGGIRELVKGFEQKVKNLHLNKKAITIDQYKKEIIFEGGDVKRFANLVTTIPLIELRSILTDIPQEIDNAFSMLRWTSIFVVNLGIKRDDVTDKHWVYYPEESMIFYRTGFPANFSLDVVPSKRTSIYAEISYKDDKLVDKERLIADTVRGLKSIGIISDENEIEICLPIDIKYGYVIYDRNRKSAVAAIKDYLKQFGIYSIGRYGGWSYMSMADVIIEGKRMAEGFKLIN